MIYYSEIHFRFNQLETYLQPIECEFYYAGIKVYTQAQGLIFKDIGGSSDVLNVGEAMARNRPKIIAIADVISFLIGYPITIYDIESQSYNVESSKETMEIDITKFIYGGQDFSFQLNKILSKIETNKNITLSLLDKWNKANYLLEADDSHVLYLDEAMLNYFHVIELLSDITKRKYEKILDKKSEELLNSFYKDTGYLHQNQIVDKVNQKKKLLKEVLIGDFIPLKDRYKYFLSYHNLLDDRVSFFIDELIKVRNSLAHGRVAQNIDVMEYPLTPFYNITRLEGRLVTPIGILTAVSISKFIGIHIWEYEWNEIKQLLEPSPDLVVDFLEGRLDVDINNKNEHNLTWYSLFLYYLTCKDKWKKVIESRVKLELSKRQLKNLDLPNLYEIAVILIDTEDRQLFKMLSYVITKIVEGNEFRWSNYRDIFLYLEVRDIEIGIIRKKVSDILASRINKK